MKVFFLSALLILSVNSYAQSEIEAINKDVWYNFMQAY